MLINERIRNLRIKRGLSQYELAKRMKSMNQSQLSKIESGTRGISVQDLVSIAEALQTDITELLGRQ